MYCSVLYLCNVLYVILVEKPCLISSLICCVCFLTSMTFQVLGDSCLCTFVFYSGAHLRMTFLSLRWLEGDQKYNRSAFFYIFGL